MIFSGTKARTRRAVLLLGNLGLWMCFMPARAGETIQILTEEYPPFNYTEKGKVVGLGTEVVQAVLKEANITGQFQSLPWARAYETAQASQNVLIYTINRSKEREKLFKWIGPITPPDIYYLFSLKSRNLQVASLDAAKNLQIGTVNQDIGEQYLASLGFAVGRNLQSSARYELNYEKLKLGRVDLWVMNELGANYLARQAGDDPGAVLHKSLRIDELTGGGNYMAFGARTPDALVERFQRGLEAIKKNGTYDSLLKKWF